MVKKNGVNRDIEIQAVHARSGRSCEAKLPGCQGKRIECIPHHIKFRSRGGSWMAENMMDVCVPCHAKIHLHYKGTEKYRTHAWQKEGVDETGRKIWARK